MAAGHDSIVVNGLDSFAKLITATETRNAIDALFVLLEIFYSFVVCLEHDITVDLKAAVFGRQRAISVTQQASRCSRRLYSALFTHTIPSPFPLLQTAAGSTFRYANRRSN